MTSSNSDFSYKPLVAAATRTGLTLMVNIARQFIAYSPAYRIEPRRYILERLCGALADPCAVEDSRERVASERIHLRSAPAWNRICSTTRCFIRLREEPSG